jgi:hypothetical protein
LPHNPTIRDKNKAHFQNYRGSYNGKHPHPWGKKYEKVKEKRKL